MPAPLTDDDQRVGRRVRALRSAAGMSHRQLAEKMREAGHPGWNADIVNRAQTGRERRLTHGELLSLARIFGVTVDALLADAIGDPAVSPVPEALPRPGAQRVGAFPADLSPGLASRGQSARLPAWPPAPGQIERLEALASRLGVTRAEALRRAVEVGLQAYEEEARARAWAQSQGIEAAARGRVPADVIALYRAAQVHPDAAGAVEG